MKKKNGRKVKEWTFVNRENPTNAFVETNGSVNARKIRKPKKKPDLGFFLNEGFFLKKTRSTGRGLPRRGRAPAGLRRGAARAAGLGLGGGGGGAGLSERRRREAARRRGARGSGGGGCGASGGG